MIYVYFDWNVFDRIEKKDTLEKSQREVYSKIEQLILDKKIISPYSNAHINDLLRGYSNNPSFIPNHLNTLMRLTNMLCIAQYWGNSKTTWHYRNVEDFFNEALEDNGVVAKSFCDLIPFNGGGLVDQLHALLRSTPVPENFKEIYKASPIFELMFFRTKKEMNLLSMCEDLYDFSNSIKKDYSLYKSLRTYFNQTKAKLKNHQNFFTQIDKGTRDIPKYLDFDESWEKYSLKTKTSDNTEYQKITDTYFKIDFKGFKSDDRFSNMIDDSLHVFYGAHCDYFITLDDKCHYKAAETYHKLGINTKAMNPTEFVNYFTA
jgi:hypothetical protein